MKLESVAFVHPERRVSNADIVSLVRRESEHTYSEDLGKLIDTVSMLLDESGAKSRYWRPTGSESVLPYVATAFAQALGEAGVSGADVDALIYAGVDRGFIEPGDSHFIAHSLGLDRIACFDIIDACNSWCRAVEVAQALMCQGRHRRIAIVNSEFSLWHGGIVMPHCFRLKVRQDLPWSFPAFTLGEGVAVTLLAHDEESEWTFRTASRTDLCDLCTVPLPGYEQHTMTTDRIGLRGPFTFTSFGSQMVPEAEKEITELIRGLDHDITSCRRIFPHAASVKAYAGPAERLGISNLMFYIYPEFGNVVSASVPAGIAIAASRGQVSRGDRLGVLVASAGMSFTACTFEY